MGLSIFIVAITLGVIIIVSLAIRENKQQI